jgi:hypothetical protein
MVGEHIPGVGFDFEVGRQRRLLVDRQRLLQPEPRRAESVAQLRQEHRHMEMGPPLPRARVLLPVLEGILEVEEPLLLTVLQLAGL